MGSYATLSLAKLTLDERKFGIYEFDIEFSPLFQPSDVRVRYEGQDEERLGEEERDEIEPDEDESDDVELDEEAPNEWRYAVKLLSHVVDRLELLGYTRQWVNKRISGLLDDCATVHSEIGSDDPSPEASTLTAEAAIHTLSGIDVLASPDGKSRYAWDVVREAITQEWKLDGKNSFFEPLLDGLGPMLLLRILAMNENNLNLDVTWDFGEGILGEYLAADEIPAVLERNAQYLIVTEGRSDAKVLGKAFRERLPHMHDFFYFVDMAEGYPFGGTGNLHNFTKGLIAIGVLNRTIILYDNDAVGISKYRETTSLSVPQNINVAHLPNLTDGKLIKATGPAGSAMADVNGTAAAIEVYLDLTVLPEEPEIRWTNYVDKLDCYQGALQNKDAYSKAFLERQPNDAAYDYSKVDLCLATIVKAAKSIADALMPESDLAYRE